MLHFLKKCLSVFLVVNHLWIFNIGYASSILSYEHIHERETTAGLLKMHPLISESGVYHLHFDDTFTRLDENQAFYFYDHSTYKIVGQLRRQGSTLGAFFDGIKVSIEHTASNVSLKIASNASVVINGVLNHDACFIAPVLTFVGEIKSLYAVEAMASTLTVKDRLRAQTLKLTALEKGIIEGDVLSLTSAVLHGHWVNQGTIASLEHVICANGSFHNTKSSHLIAGGLYQNLCANSREEGSVIARLGGVLQGETFGIKSSFHFQGASLDALYQDGSMENIHGHRTNVSVRDRATFRFGRLSGFDGLCSGGYGRSYIWTQLGYFFGFAHSESVPKI